MWCTCYSLQRACITPPVTYFRVSSNFITRVVNRRGCDVQQRALGHKAGDCVGLWKSCQAGLSTLTVVIAVTAEGLG